MNQVVSQLTTDAMQTSHPSIASLSDDAIFEEAALRLKRHYYHENGLEFRHGRFEFIFHDGRFQAIEEHHRAKIYLSPNRFKQG